MKHQYHWNYLLQNIPFDVDAWRDGDILASKVLEEETTANNEVDQLRT